MRALFDLHDVCDVIRERIRVLDDQCDVEGNDPDTTAARERRHWRWCLERVREASRKEAG